MIPALTVDAAVFILVALIITHYHRFYSHYCQLMEPWTRWFSRIAEAFPWFWWPLNVSLAVYSALTARFSPWYWCPIGFIGVAFMGWFMPHIHDYIQAHPDNPPNRLKARLGWIGRFHV